MTKKLLIVSDLDGTLLSGELMNHDTFIISDFNKKAIKVATDAGHVFCIATGRAWSEAETIYNSAGIETIMINSNGTYIHNPNDSNFKPIHTPVGKEVANNILQEKWLKDNVLSYVAPSLTAVTRHKILDDFSGKEWYQNLEEIPAVNGLITHEVNSFVIVLDVDADLEAFSKVMDKYKDVVTYHNWGTVYKGKYQFYDINSISCKGFGIKKLSEYYGIPQENIITFGDQLNDVTMTKWAGKGFAMKNANVGLKLVADEVLDKTNNEDGVGHKIMELIKGNT